MTGYSTIIVAHYSDYDSRMEDKVIELDLITQKNVDTNSTVTSTPVVETDFISDHMYREPISISLSGSFGINGYKATIYNTSDNRLTSIEQTFEDIKDKAIICTVSTRSRDDKSMSQFVVRENMALTSISWTENQNTLDFTFRFTEVIMATEQLIEYDENVLDETLPALTTPDTLDFTETYIDWSKVDELVIKCCYDVGAISKEFLEGIGTTAGLWFGGALVGAIAVGAIAGSWAGPIGIGVGALVGATIGAGIGIYTTFRKIYKDQHHKYKQWKYYKNDKKYQQELESFANFVGQIHTNLEQLEDAFTAYSISSNQNQECLLTIDNEYYTFSFIRNNDTQHYSLTITNLKNNKPIQIESISGLTNLSECTGSNYILMTSNSNYRVYLMNVALSNELLSDYDRETCRRDLTNYTILVSSINMDDYNKMLTKIIKNALKR